MPEPERTNPAQKAQETYEKRKGEEEKVYADKLRFLHKRESTGKLLPVEYELEKGVFVQFVPATRGELAKLELEVAVIAAIEDEDTRTQANIERTAELLAEHMAVPKLTKEELVEAGITGQIDALFNAWYMISKLGYEKTEQMRDSFRAKIGAGSIRE